MIKSLTIIILPDRIKFAQEYIKSKGLNSFYEACLKHKVIITDIKYEKKL